tara:strand:+ start:242 stop:448 length:207 start_codon:yes stop_codon:yes gene_type:complete
LKEGGMMRLNQKKNSYFKINDENADVTESEDDLKRVLSKHREYNELSESMEEDEPDDTYDQLFDDRGN